MVRPNKSLIYGLFFVVLGIVLVLYAWVLAGGTQKQLENWVEVEGTIVDTEVLAGGEHSGWGGSKSYGAHLKVTFKYEYGGKTYQGILKREFIKKNTKDAAEAYVLDKASKSYKIGSSIMLYVNSANPQEITGSISFAPSIVLGIVGLVSFIIGLIVWKFHLK